MNKNILYKSVVNNFRIDKVVIDFHTYSSVPVVCCFTEVDYAASSQITIRC